MSTICVFRFRIKKQLFVPSFWFMWVDDGNNYFPMENGDSVSPGLSAGVAGGMNTTCCLIPQIISVPQMLYISSCYICV